MPRFGSTYKRWKYDSSVPMPMSTFYAQKKHAEKRKRNSEYSVYNGKDIDLIDQRVLINIEDICYDDVNIEINEYNICTQDEDNNNVEDNDENNNNVEDNDDDDNIEEDNVEDNNFHNLVKNWLQSSNAGHHKIEFACAQMAAFFIGRMTQHSMSIQLKLWNAVLGDLVPKNFNELCKIILKDENDKITYEKTWYCNRCKNYVVVNDKKQRKCIICKQRLLMFYHLKLANQVRHILSSLNMLTEIKKSNTSTKTGIYKDVTDGLLYKRVLESEIGKEIKNKTAFTFTINTDGINMSNSSTLSMWPVFLVLNEANADVRFCIENVIVAGNCKKTNIK
jgi:hypothetical protein